jgi:hypothetical protein
MRPPPSFRIACPPRRLAVFGAPARRRRRAGPPWRKSAQLPPARRFVDALPYCFFLGAPNHGQVDAVEQALLDNQPGNLFLNIGNLDIADLYIGRA